MYLAWTIAGLALLALPVGYFVWLRQMTRPPAAGRAVAPEYAPPEGFGPAEVGLILENALHPRALAAMVLDLHLRGFIEIVEVGGTVAGLRRSGASGVDSLTACEQLLLGRVFAGSDAVPVARAAAAVSGLRRELGTCLRLELRRKGVYEDMGAAPMIIFGSAVLAAATLSFGLFRALGLFAATAVGAVIVLLSQLGYFAATVRPPLSAAGRKLAATIDGFRMYLGAVEGERIKWETLEAGTVNRFSPYAVIFDIDITWANRLQGLTKALLANIL